jgi:hypothetical protein
MASRFAEFRANLPPGAVQHMQQALELMNVKFTEVGRNRVSDHRRDPGRRTRSRGVERTPPSPGGQLRRHPGVEELLVRVRSSLENYNLERCHESDPMFQEVRPMTLLGSLRSLVVGRVLEEADQLPPSAQDQERLSAGGWHRCTGSGSARSVTGVPSHVLCHRIPEPQHGCDFSDGLRPGGVRHALNADGLRVYPSSNMPAPPSQPPQKPPTLSAIRGRRRPAGKPRGHALPPVRLPRGTAGV